MVTKYSYQAYDSSLVLTRRISILDTTTIVYDSTFRRRPKQALLPTVRDPSGTLVNPIIGYTPVESRGYGALVRVDSIGPYVEMKDPRGNWTRSWLNRWGQAVLSWDTLGVLGRNRFADDGRVLTSEGKIGGDTTRTYYRYDAFQRLVKTYINRVENGKGVLRTDSLVYDGNHRVMKRVDSRGKVDSVSYDGKGNVISATDPAGFITRYWYGANGLVDSILPPSSFQKMIYRYEGTWKQLMVVRVGTNTTSTLVDSSTYDSYGRLSASMQRVPVRVVSGTQKFQWRQTVPYYRVTNQTDSSIVSRTDECGPCLTPGSFGTDTLHTIKIGYRFDRAGRDSLRLASNDTSKATRYLYDALGRLLTRTPPSSAGTPPRDSLLYDVAGNVLKLFGRRGDSVITVYDSRNRMSTRTVSGVGIYTSVYSGPLDQLTRLYLASPVDSIGGVNGEVRYGYDRRGRLVADTSYSGAMAQATSHVYDVFERDSIAVDPTGTWKTRYDTDRGLLSMVVSPFSDSMYYAFDGKGRNTVRAKYSSGPTNTSTLEYTATGVSALIRHLVGSWNPGTSDPEGVQDEMTGAAPLGPTWTEQHGSGAAVDSTIDSLQYDGWQRLTSWRQQAKSGGSWSLSASDSVWFDRDGNIHTPGGSESYDSKTSRLLSRNEAGWHWSYTYDLAGNQTQVAGDSASVKQDTWKYGYDGLGRLVSVRRRLTGWVADSLVARYGYDVLGRRIVRRIYSPSSPTGAKYIRYSYTGVQVAFEADSAGTKDWQYTWGMDVDDLVGIHRGAVDYAVVQDQLRSVRGLVRRDGSWIMNQFFTPYGRLSRLYGGGGVSTMPYGWTGREYDAETGLYFNRARYYDPGQRRFTQEDPIGFEGGTNQYAYAGGDVLNGRDPSGKNFCTLSMHFLGVTYETENGVNYVTRWWRPEYDCGSGRDMTGPMAGGGGGAASTSDQVDDPGKKCDILINPNCKKTTLATLIPSVCGGGGFGYGAATLHVAPHVGVESLGLVEYDSQEGGAHGGAIGLEVGPAFAGVESLRTWRDGRVHTGPLVIGGSQFSAAGRKFGTPIKTGTFDVGGFLNWMDGQLSLGGYLGGKAFGGGGYLSLSWSGCNP